MVLLDGAGFLGNLLIGQMRIEIGSYGLANLVFSLSYDTRNFTVTVPQRRRLVRERSGEGRGRQASKIAVPANRLALKIVIRHIFRHPARWIVLAAALAVFFFGPLTVTHLIAAENRPVEITGVRDFVEYWSASRLLLSGGNPYAPKELLALQQAVGWRDAVPLIMWNPPWTLSLLLPFGLLEFGLSQFVWLLGHVLAVLISVHLLWRVYGDSPNGLRLSWLLAFTFIPTVFVLILGQITPLVLAGIAAFIFLEKVF